MKSNSLLSTRNLRSIAFCAALFGSFVTLATDNLAALVADRAAIERVYYARRIGAKPPFEETLPRAALENLVKFDLKKERALKKVYGVEIAASMVEAEVWRINTTTRAPEVLEEIKAALGHDPVRFARAMARPVVAERELRNRFENDDQLHAAQRRRAERERAALLAAKQKGASLPEVMAALKQHSAEFFHEIVWHLDSRPADRPDTNALEVKRRFGPNAQFISGADDVKERKLYFDDLQPELQNVLRAQLRQAGDVSAVIETPTGFLLYLAREKTPERLSVAALSLPKRSYEDWIEVQSK